MSRRHLYHQIEITERNAQVNTMAQIYGFASAVTVRLGRANESAPARMANIDTLVRTFELDFPALAAYLDVLPDQVVYQALGLSRNCSCSVHSRLLGPPSHFMAVNFGLLQISRLDSAASPAS